MVFGSREIHVEVEECRVLAEACTRSESSSSARMSRVPSGIEGVPDSFADCLAASRLLHIEGKVISSTRKSGLLSGILAFSLHLFPSLSLSRIN